MDRRAFLGKAGIAGAAALAVTASGGAYVAGVHNGNHRLTGDLSTSVVAGQRRGRINVWWSVDAADKVLALTFDDGPTTQFSPQVLDILHRYEVPATFFLIGELVQRHRETVQRMIADGHALGNHTFDHFSAAIQSAADVRATIERGADAIAAVSGERPRWFRPVKGHVTGSVLQVANELGHDIAMWSVSRDPGIGTALTDVDGVRQNYLDGVHEGAIVIFHDGIGRSAWEVTGPDRDLMAGRRTEIRALPDVVETYLAEGYRFLTLDELIAEHGAVTG